MGYGDFSNRFGDIKKEGVQPPLKPAERVSRKSEAMKRYWAKRKAREREAS